MIPRPTELRSPWLPPGRSSRFLWGRFRDRLHRLQAERSSFHGRILHSQQIASAASRCLKIQYCTIGKLAVKSLGSAVSTIHQNQAGSTISAMHQNPPKLKPPRQPKCSSSAYNSGWMMDLISTITKSASGGPSTTHCSQKSAPTNMQLPSTK